MSGHCKKLSYEDKFRATTLVVDWTLQSTGLDPVSGIHLT